MCQKLPIKLRCGLISSLALRYFPFITTMSPTPTIEEIQAHRVAEQAEKKQLRAEEDAQQEQEFTEGLAKVAEEHQQSLGELYEVCSSTQRGTHAIAVWHAMGRYVVLHSHA